MPSIPHSRAPRRVRCDALSERPVPVAIRPPAEAQRRSEAVRGDMPRLTNETDRLAASAQAAYEGQMPAAMDGAMPCAYDSRLSDGLGAEHRGRQA